MTLAFSLERLMTEQCVVERAVRSYDGGGAQTTGDWGPHLTVPCRLWWDKSSGIRSAQREWVSAARTADLSAGGIMIPSGTDVLRTDRIAEIQAFNPETGEWTPYISGNLDISGVITLDDHMELYITRTNVGP